MSKFITDLIIKDVTDSIVELMQPLVYQSDLLGCEICIPVGFQSDQSSVPRIPAIYTLYGNRAHKEGVLHDAAYCIDFPWKISRKEADLLFLEAMCSRGKPFHIRYPMYEGVRLFGWQFYHKRKMEQAL